MSSLARHICRSACVRASVEGQNGRHPVSEFKSEWAAENSLECCAAILDACAVEDVRRLDDGELCGHVESHDGVWSALVIFGAPLGQRPTRENAIEQVLTDGLASLAERWTLRYRDGSDEVVCIQEANAHAVTLARGYYSIPGVPTLTLRATDLTSGEWSLQRSH